MAQFPSSTNLFIKSHEASGSLIVDFSRDPSKFAVAEYAQIVPVKKPAGLYQVMTVEEAGRVLGADAAEYDWADGADAPDGSDGTESFDYPQFQTRRSAYPYRLGQRTVDNAEWEIAAQHGRIHAQKAMTVRTMRAVTALTTSGNYDATHVSAISGGSITGTTGTWAQSTSTRQDIKRSLNHAAELIMLDTLSAIDIDELMVVLSPTLAKEMSVSQEIVDMIKQSSDAKYYVSGEGKFTNKNAKFGLPPTLYGYPIVIENTVRVTSRKGATKARSFVMPASSAVMCSRPGGIDGVAGQPSFSTLTMFMLEEMTVETKQDPDNRLTKGRVVDDYATVMTAPVSGFLFTGCS